MEKDCKPGKRNNIDRVWLLYRKACISNRNVCMYKYIYICLHIYIEYKYYRVSLNIRIYIATGYKDIHYRVSQKYIPRKPVFEYA